MLKSDCLGLNNNSVAQWPGQVLSPLGALLFPSVKWEYWQCQLHGTLVRELNRIIHTQHRVLWLAQSRPQWMLWYATQMSFRSKGLPPPPADAGTLPENRRKQPPGDGLGWRKLLVQDHVSFQRWSTTKNSPTERCSGLVSLIELAMILWNITPASKTLVELAEACIVTKLLTMLNAASLLPFYKC